MSPRISLGEPAATMRISACRVNDARSRVCRWQYVTVASALSSISPIGRPTMLLRPTMTQCLPSGEMPYSCSMSIIPAGVHGISVPSPVTMRPTFIGWKASTSFSGAIAFITARSDICSGSGSCTRIPSTPSSALSAAISRRSSASDVVAARSYRRLSMPHLRQSRSLLRTYICDAGSFPTSTAARQGLRLSAAASLFTSSQSFSASFFPSIKTPMFLVAPWRTPYTFIA